MIDLVNISVAAKLIPDVIRDCGQKGVKFAIVHSAGFKEVGEEGIRREREMVELAHSYGMRIYGPNCQGVQNSDPAVSLYANFTFVPMKPGTVSIIAQGGGMGEMLKLHLHKVGLGHRLYASYGNECDLSMPELLDYFGQDEGTRVIMMQTESYKDPAAFLEVAARITPKKPILAIKAGRTREGAVGVSSHTGALDGANWAYGTLTSAMATDATTFTVTNGTYSSAFPTTNFTVVVFSATCSTPSYCAARELILVTSRSGSTLYHKRKGSGRDFPFGNVGSRF